MQSICILGSTGSIGKNTLEVVRRHRDKYRVFALAANSNIELIFQQCCEFLPEYVALSDEAAASRLQELVRGEKLATQVLVGEKGIEYVAAAEADTVVAAIVGAAGLQSTMAAVQAGRKVLLANKEALVMSGRLFTQAANQAGAKILPIDSEHNAIFQCLPPLAAGASSLDDLGVRKVILTGSGGPFRTRDLSELADVTPAEACDHPNWDMGRKISVDSATMMNKGLEFIEACWLFDIPPEKIQVVIHPQSIVHSLVEYVDGSVLAQLSNPDMRTPIAHCLAWPERITSGAEPLDFYKLGSLDFFAPDYARFPCLRMAIEAKEKGGTYPIALNAANEIAVSSFLAKEISFTKIAEVIEKVLKNWLSSEPKTLVEVIKADLQARKRAQEVLEIIEYN